MIADSPSGRTDRTVVVGAHLDSVPEGPGINDNGSGTATDLEIALQMAELGIEPRNRVRFAFWGAEESGLIGSQHYVDSLDEERAQGPRPLPQLRHGRLTELRALRLRRRRLRVRQRTARRARARSRRSSTEYFASQGLESEPTEFDGRSDYDAFINAGVPAGGLFTGAEGIKTAEQAAIYGGTAGVAYDPCYHQACDTIDNVNKKALDEMSDAIAHATLVYAMTTSSVNGTDNASNKAKENMQFRGSLLKK